MTPTQTDPTQRLRRAKVSLLLDHPFFGTLATRLPNELDETTPTAAINGERIRWNPTFLAGLTDRQLLGVYIHEILHAANGHCWRRGNRDTEAWNIATDKAINSILRDLGMELPDGALYPTAGEEGKAAEAYYSSPAPQPQKGKPANGKAGAGKGKPGGNNPANGSHPGQSDGGGDPGGCGAVEDAPAKSPEQKRQAEQDWKIAITQAAAAAKGQGKLPSSLQRLVDEIVHPALPWESLLRDFVERTARNDYNWTVPNRRYLTGGIILPSLTSEELPAVVVAIDTSGSISPEVLKRFASEVSGVLGAYDTTIHLVYCDARVQGSEEYCRADLPLRPKAIGGGGTAFQPVFDWVTKRGLTPACLIYLTDGYGPFPKAEPEYPVLWVCTTDVQAPIGQTIRLK